MRHLPSHTFSMGHSFFPFLAAFIAHYISHHYGVYQFTRGTFPSHFIMGYLSFPFNNFIDSWGTYPFPSHFCSSNISHFWHTWSPRLFLLTALKYFLVHSLKSQFHFCLFSQILHLFNLFSLNHVFQCYLSMHSAWGIKPSHLHCSVGHLFQCFPSWGIKPIPIFSYIPFSGITLGFSHFLI